MLVSLNRQTSLSEFRILLSFSMLWDNLKRKHLFLKDLTELSPKTMWAVCLSLPYLLQTFQGTSHPMWPCEGGRGYNPRGPGLAQGLGMQMCPGHDVSLGRGRSAPASSGISPKVTNMLFFLPLVSVPPKDVPSGLSQFLFHCSCSTSCPMDLRSARGGSEALITLEKGKDRETGLSHQDETQPAPNTASLVRH